MSDTDDKPSCRFCLMTKETPDNRLLAPCACRGSIQFVHVACLNRWRHMDPNKNALQCLLCLSLYNLPYESNLENLPVENTWPVLFLRYPIFLYAIIHYIWIFHQHYHYERNVFSYHYSSSTSLIIPYQFIFQTLYFIIFASEWKVKNKKLYFEFWLNSSGALLVAFHIVSLYYFLQDNYLMTLPILYVLHLYYKNHRYNLMRINDQMD